MKKRILLAVIALAAAMTVNAQTLVVYYSRSGSNYTSDGIVDLKVGNTQVVAEQIQKTDQGRYLPPGDRENLSGRLYGMHTGR